jgi:hypothetical protein
MTISSDYHLIPYEAGGGGWLPRADDRSGHPAAGGAALRQYGRSSDADPYQPVAGNAQRYRTYSARRTAHAASRPVTGLVVDIFV